MKKSLYMAVAVIAALSSCSSDEAILNELGHDSNDITTFTATIEGNDLTRATYNATTKKAEWEMGDAISIDGHDYTATTAGDNTTFTGSGATESTHHAYFPASLYSSGTAELPAIQTYEEGKFNMPMYAESATTDFVFKNLCAILAIKVTSADIPTLKSIKVKSDKYLNGSFTVSGDKAVVDTDGTKELVLKSSSALSLDASGTTFYIAIPAQTYQYLTIYLSADGTTYTQAMATKKTDGLGTIARNAIYSIDYEKNAVQLWADGPYFATMNIGANSETDYGGYYTWGGSYKNGESITWTDDHNTGVTVLSGNADTATKLWGSAWRMPSMANIYDLYGTSYCTSTWQDTGVKGRIFEGKDGTYASNSVFLPAAGYCDDAGVGLNDTYGFYYSSENYGLDNAYFMSFDSSDLGSTYDNRYYGRSVRAVLVE